MGNLSGFHELREDEFVVEIGESKFVVILVELAC